MAYSNNVGAIIVVGGLLLLLATIPESIANSKGRSYLGFLLFGLFLFFPALVVSVAIRREPVVIGGMVKTRGTIKVSGGKLPSGWASKVLDVGSHEGTPAVLIEGRDGRSHWVDRKFVNPI